MALLNSTQSFRPSKCASISCLDPMELLVCFSDLESLGCGQSTSYLLMHLPPIPLSSITPICSSDFFLLQRRCSFVCVKLEATTTCRCFGLVFGGGAFKASITSWPFGLHGGVPPLSSRNSADVGIEVLDL